jgi:DNA-binding NarL/FixJ family response regulator
MTALTKIIIVDDNTLFREGIKFLIEEENLGEIIAEAENGQVFLSMLEKQNPDLVLMDIEMPVMDGLEATRKALAMRPGLKILGLTMFFEMEYLNAMMLSGAMGFVLKTSGKQELENAIRRVIRGETNFPNPKVVY